MFVCTFLLSMVLLAKSAELTLSFPKQFFSILYTTDSKVVTKDLKLCLRNF